jgi:hypothetical protein
MLKITGLIPTLLLLPVSLYALACGDKISDALCQNLSITATATLIPIVVIFKEPPFEYPDKMTVSEDSVRNYSLMMVDSLARYFSTTVKPQIDSIVTRYDLRSLMYSNHRILISEIGYGYQLFAATNKQVIVQLVNEPAVGKIELYIQQYPVSYSIAPDSQIFKTKFPFDTVISGYVALTYDNRLSFANNSIAILRYGLVFIANKFNGPAICPEQVRADFCIFHQGASSDIKYPVDGSALLQGTDYCGPAACCTSKISIDTNWRTHEYRFPTAASFLYMKVVEPFKADSIRIRFDSISLLTTPLIQFKQEAKAPIRPIPFIDVANHAGVIRVQGYGLTGNCHVTFYDVIGKRLFKDYIGEIRNKPVVFPASNYGIFIVKVTSGNKDLLCKRFIITDH